MTGIIKPHWIETKSSWSFISYKDLSINIKKIFRNEKNNIGVQIVEYAHNNLNVCKIIVDFLDNRLNWILNEDVEYLQKLKLDSICHKLQANRFLEFCRNKKEYKCLEKNVNKKI